MKRLFYSLLLSTAVLSITSCGEKADKGNTEADSLRNVIGANMAEMDEMNLFLDAVNTSMDSVVNMEGGILRTSGESPMSKKEQIKQNLEAYKMMLERQRERISILEAKLKDGDAKSKKMLQTIQALKKQIEEKDKTIVELTEELEKRKFDIVTLKSHVDKLNTNVAQLKEEKAEQEKALEAQSDMLNEAYVVIGSKKELKAAGLMTGGSLFKKSKLDMSKVNASAFKKIDIRNVKSFKIPANRYEILSQMPSGSYKVSNNSDGTSTLTITDATRFWSVTNYLVIKY